MNKCGSLIKKLHILTGSTVGINKCSRPLWMKKEYYRHESETRRYLQKNVLFKLQQGRTPFPVLCVFLTNLYFCCHYPHSCRVQSSYKVLQCITYSWVFDKCWCISIHFSINPLHFIKFLYDNQFCLWKMFFSPWRRVAMEIINLHKL